MKKCFGKKRKDIKIKIKHTSQDLKTQKTRLKIYNIEVWRLKFNVALM